MKRHWVIPIHISFITYLKDAEAIPPRSGNSSYHFRSWKKITKNRVTRGASWRPLSSHSITNDTINELLSPCIRRSFHRSIAVRSGKVGVSIFWVRIYLWYKLQKLFNKNTICTFYDKSIWKLNFILCTVNQKKICTELIWNN